jgi:hypothetical protein
MQDKRVVFRIGLGSISTFHIRSFAVHISAGVIQSSSEVTARTFGTRAEHGSRWYYSKQVGPWNIVAGSPALDATYSRQACVPSEIMHETAPRAEGCTVTRHYSSQPWYSSCTQLRESQTRKMTNAYYYSAYQLMQMVTHPTCVLE